VLRRVGRKETASAGQLLRTGLGIETMPHLEGLTGKRLDRELVIGRRAQRRLEERSVDVSTIDELKAAFAERPVFATAPFCDTPECEDAVKSAVHALTVRVLRADRAGGGAPCVACGEPAEFSALLARSY